MNTKQLKLRVGLLAAGLLAAGGALADTGGGATIHNAATLTYAGGVVTDSVDVEVLTVGTAPTLVADNVTPSANGGDTYNVTYTITSNSNGADSYSITAGSVDTGTTGTPTLTPSTTSIPLGASFTSADSTGIDADTGTIYIAAGSETNLASGDTVVINGFTYLVDAVRPGTPASTSGNSTTAEVPTELDLTLQNGAPPIGGGTINAGTQVGERATFTVEVIASLPSTQGVDGSHSVYVEGNTSADGPGGSPVPFTTQGDPAAEVVLTVLSGDVTLVKDARNVTLGGSFAASGVQARPGDTLEYRIRATPVAGSGNAALAVLRDEIPLYTNYVVDSTTLDGAAVSDDAGTGNARFPLAAANSGLGINSATGAADQASGGIIVDGETATVIFQVIVE